MADTHQSHRIITAFFDDRSEASRAVESLRNAGITDSAIRMIEGDESGSQTVGLSPGSSSATDASSYDTTTPREDKGFFAMLGDLFMPADDRHTYAEGLNRGGYVVSVEAMSGEEDTVIDILDVEGSVDMDSRSDEWSASGWERPASNYDTGAGYQPGMTGAVESDVAMSGDRDMSLVPTGVAGATAGVAGTVARETTRDDGYSTPADGDKIQVAAEQIRVGKRDVSHGRVKIRSYVVETPVEEDISLRTERVDIQRQAVDRPVTSADDLFRDKSIEVEERAEEAVVSKDARIVEEIAVGKTVENRTETVRDSVRRTEVEIDDQRVTGDASLRGGVTTDRTTSGTYGKDDRTLMDSIKGGLGLDDDTVRGGSSSR